MTPVGPCAVFACRSWYISVSDNADIFFVPSQTWRMWFPSMCLCVYTCDHFHVHNFPGSSRVSGCGSPLPKECMLTGILGRMWQDCSIRGTLPGANNRHGRFRQCVRDARWCVTRKAAGGAQIVGSAEAGGQGEGQSASRSNAVHACSQPIKYVRHLPTPAQHVVYTCQRLPKFFCDTCQHLPWQALALCMERESVCV